MILSVGIDSVSVERFKSWSSINATQLKKVFPEEEIAYCLKTPQLSAQRFAVRFAAREAFFKALCSMQKKAEHPFLKVCKSVKLLHTDNQIPVLEVQWSKLTSKHETAQSVESLVIHCSLTHTCDIATAFVVIEKR